MSKQHTVAVYYFPQYHADSRNEQWHGKGWTEWEMVKSAKPRFEGHSQPKVPLWGHYDEADPEVSKLQIETASHYGVDAFIYDWYWYDETPFLHRALEQGFMNAENNHLLKFSLMWANHDWSHLYPVRRNKHVPMLTPGAVSMESFEKMTDYIVEKYFKHPSYWLIEGRPYFSIFDTKTFVNGLGGLVQARVALESFRRKTKAAGFEDLHLNCVIHGIHHFVKGEAEMNALFDMLRFDSVAPYIWGFPETTQTVDYAEWADAGDPYKYKQALEAWEIETGRLSIPYFPNITTGWDVSPRADQEDQYDIVGYPYTSILVNNTPEQLEKVLYKAKQFLDKGMTKPSVLIINAWNEWTEGSYLEPDAEFGFGRLDALKKVFG